MPTSAKKGRILSGMRPTGKLHLGNYVGALRNWVGLQDDYECFFFIADWHALTTDYADTRSVKQNCLEVMLDYLAAGLDPERSTMFIQSHVLQHAELHLLFSMITPLGWLERVPSYKEQRENIKDKDLGTYGFLGYPLLQAADILLYSPPPDLPEAERKLFVPVGEDQVPHVELTREVARRFNQFYPRVRLESGWQSTLAEDFAKRVPEEIATFVSPKGERVETRPFTVEGLRALQRTPPVFPEPQPLLTPAAKLPGTDGRKMSKSYGNTILLSEPEKSLRQKLKTMVTDPARIRRTDPGNPDVCPVGDLHKIFSTAETMAKVNEGCRSAGIGCIECKQWASDSLWRVLGPMQERRQRYEANPKLAWDILEEGSRKARAVAEATMIEARAAAKLVARAAGKCSNEQLATSDGQS
jgi:tryptophanyl-tRNA synthetase